MLAFGWSTPEIIVILFVVLLLFGAKRLPELARSVGKSLREFKKAASDVEDNFRAAMDEDERKKQLPPPPPASSAPASSPTPASAPTDKPA
ncbi:MAG: twin-arginine translocase TatA/TatE family subunit [Opitutales bacterium]|jgi:sec-independent protein translocase protein TatA